MIESFFGCESLWNITAYLAQQSLHPFMSHGPTETTNSFLTLLDDMTQKSTMSKISLAHQLEMRDRASLSSFADVKVCECPPTEKVDTSVILIQLEEAHKTVVEEELTLQKAREELSWTLLKKEYDSLPSLPSVKELEEELRLAKAFTTSSERRRVLELSRKPITLSLTVKDARDAISLSQKRRAEEERCTCPYDRAIIEGEKKRLSLLCDALRKEEQLQGELESLIVPVQDEEATKRIERGEARLFSLESECASRVGQACPSCGVILTMVGGQFKEGSLTQAQHNALTQERDTLRANLKRDRRALELYANAIKRKEELQQELGRIRASLPPLEKKEVFRTHSILESLTYYEAVPYTEDELQKHVEALAVEEELASLPLMQRRTLEVEVDLGHARRREELSRLFPSRFTEREGEYITVQETRLSEARRKEESLMRLLKDAEETNRTHSSHLHCKEKREGLENYLATEKSVTRLSLAMSEHIASSEEHLSEAIEAINFHLRDLSRDLYKKDIILQLVSRRRAQKGTVEMIVFYDGIECSTASLSGGEKKRASIITLLALIAYKGPLFVVLDEPFGDVEDTWESAMLDLVARRITHIPCIILHHGSMGSVVDNIVHI